MTTPSGNGALERPSNFPWPPVLLVAAAVGAWLMQGFYPLGWPGADDLPARAVGLSFGIGGLGLLAWSAITLRRHATTIMPHQGASHLVTDGPYARFRNPIYLADVMILLGLAEATKNFWFAIFALHFAVLVTKFAILPEERHLAAKFPEAWPAYAERTRRWI